MNMLVLARYLWDGRFFCQGSDGEVVGDAEFRFLSSLISHLAAPAVTRR